MPTPSFLIVADRGSLKAYTVEHPSTRGPVARLVESHQIEEAHGRFADRYTDQAGSFPVGGSPAHAIAERTALKTETDHRIFRQLAGHITSLLQEHAPKYWGFAAPSEIHAAILEGVAADHRARLTRAVRSDLTKTEPGELLRHFALPPG